MLAHIEPFWSWHTPIAWTGYVLFTDGLVWQRRGDSLLRSNPSEAVFMAVVSVLLWIVFEIYNKYALHNWYYTGLPENRIVRAIGYAWAFATILPGIFETSEVLGALRERTPYFRRTVPPRIPLGAAGATAVATGAAFVVYPFLHPSTWIAALVWLGFILLLDPINALMGAESIRGDLREGHRNRLVNLLLGGLVCGVVWECWNYWAHTKWVYNVPVPPHIKIFEMPLAGYGGFPPFAVECFAMYVFVRHLIWRGTWRPIAL
jgi:hypothetical protein